MNHILFILFLYFIWAFSFFLVCTFVAKITHPRLWWIYFLWPAILVFLALAPKHDREAPQDH